MPEPTDVEREQEIRAEHERADGTHASRMFNSERDFLLRLLDAERARADAAEAAHRHASRHGWDLGFKAGWSEHDERTHAGDTASRWWEGQTSNPFTE